MSNHNKTEDCPLSKDEIDLHLVHTELRAVGRDVEEIKTAITGNTKLGIQGLVKRIDGNESDIAALKKWRDNINLRVAYTSGLVSGVAFGILEGAKELLKTLLNHHTP